MTSYIYAYGSAWHLAQFADAASFSACMGTDGEASLLTACPVEIDFVCDTSAVTIVGGSFVPAKDRMTVAISPDTSSAKVQVLLGSSLVEIYEWITVTCKEEPLRYSTSSSTSGFLKYSSGRYAYAYDGGHAAWPNAYSKGYQIQPVAASVAGHTPTAYFHFKGGFQAASVRIPIFLTNFVA